MRLKFVVATGSLVIACFGAILGCARTTEPSLRESWVADLTASRNVLYLAFEATSPTFTGTGSLSALLEPGAADALTLAGTRRADTLDILISRSNGGQLRFVGWYVAKGTGLFGHLDGGEFAHVGASFRRNP